MIIALIIGWIAWYFYYGLECFINGGNIGRNSYLMHFPLMWEELMWILPGGSYRRMDFAKGDAELAKNLPGIPHFILTHILIPFGPAIVWGML